MASVKNKYVYHASKVQGLKTVKPQRSTHKINWVYATATSELATVFLGNWTDFVLMAGTEDEVPYLVERFKGALEIAYSNTKGSIYKLSSDNFKENQTGWKDELVSENEEEVIKEYKINNALNTIRRLYKDNKIKIYFYGDECIYIPPDKSDLVEFAVSWTREFGKETLEEVKKYHPDILPEVLKRIKHKNFSFHSE